MLYKNSVLADSIASEKVEGFGENRGIGPNDDPENGFNCSAAYCF